VSEAVQKSRFVDTGGQAPMIEQRRQVEQKTIAVLDDSEIQLEVVRTELEAAGYRVLTASDLDSLSRLLQGGDKVDLILLDVEMPEVFGDQLGAALKQSVGVGCPIHLLSSLDAHTLARRVLRAGLDGYICKGDGMEALVTRLHEIFADPAAPDA
jgi:DNA-binding response OmpR family regulator